jgi:TonB-linked SusC/RagA family outer membrane protein
MRKLKNYKKILLLSIITLFTVFTQTYAQTNTVIGTVKDEKGNPLSGVTVIVQNSKNASSTDKDGKFSVKALSTDKIVFTFIGMKKQEIKVGSQTQINVILLDEASELKDVIVVGYNSKKSAEISSSVVSLNAEKLATSTATSLDGVDLLQGKVAGLTIFENNYDAGSAPSVRIRGTGSLNASSEPLWVVDGVISSANAFNPNDVASITVMKDAGATSLYGSKAASGVIVVTTKKGNAGKGVYNINSSYGINTPIWGNFKGFMNSAQLYDYHHEAFINDNTYLTSPTNTEALWMSNIMRGRTRDSVIANNFDWLGAMYPKGNSQKNDFSYSGGSDKATQHISLNYNKIDGTLRGDNEEQVSGQINLTNKLGDKWKLDTRFFVAMRKTNYALFSENTRPASFDTPLNNDGSLKSLSQLQTDWIASKSANLLIYDVIGNVNSQNSFNFNPYIGLTYEFSPKLKFASSTQYRYSSQLSKVYRSGDSYVNDVDFTQGILGTTNASLQRQQSTGNSLLNNEIFTFNQKFEKSTLNLLAGFEYESTQGDGFTATNTGLVNGISVLSATTGVPIVKGIPNEVYRVSYFSQLNYNINYKYFFTGSYRRDGSSKFGSANRFGNFYSASAGWLISNESFMKNNSKTISNLKLRASYGATGNDNFTNYSAVETFSLGANYNFQSGASPSQYANPNLTWEKAFTSNVGVDLSLLKKIDLTFDFYRTDNKDILYQVPLDPTTGFNTGWKNIGNIRNKGFEFSASGNIINSKNFKWYSNLSFAYNFNEVISLNNAGVQGIIDSKANKILKVGMDVNTSYYFDYVGADPKTGLATWNTIDSTGKINGTTTWRLNPNIAYKTKNLSPHLTGGFNNKLSYNGISLDIMVSYAGDFYSAITSDQWFRNGETAIQGQSSAILGNYWQNPGDQAYFPRPFYTVYGTTATVPNKPTGQNVVKGDFIKVNYITLGFELPKVLLDKYKMSNVSLYARLNNPFLYVFDKNFVYTTPESQGYGGDVKVNNSLRPIQQSLIFGVNCSF